MTTEEVKVKAVEAKAKAKKVVNTQDLTIDQATADMIDRSREMEVETIFDRAQTMKA